MQGRIFSVVGGLLMGMALGACSVSGSSASMGVSQLNVRGLGRVSAPDSGPGVVLSDERGGTQAVTSVRIVDTTPRNTDNVAQTFQELDMVQNARICASD